MSDLVERARFLAAGQGDPHSQTITELCDRIEAMRRAIRITGPNEDDGEVWVHFKAPDTGRSAGVKIPDKSPGIIEIALAVRSVWEGEK